MGDVKLGADALDLLKQNVPELGGQEFGIARTKTGNFAIVPLGNEVYRVASMEWQRAPPDHHELPSDELREAICRVIGVELQVGTPVWLSWTTDSSRLVDQYRIGRILLAGDAAHVHWAYGGLGLQTGLQEAGNLGWKLAATVQGWAPSELLDSYHTERHPVGERLLMSTRAQEALAHPSEHVTAFRKSSVTARQELKQRLSVNRINRPFINEGGWVAMAGLGGATGQAMEPENALPSARRAPREAPPEYLLGLRFALHNGLEKKFQVVDVAFRHAPGAVGSATIGLSFRAKARIDCGRAE